MHHGDHVALLQPGIAGGGTLAAHLFSRRAQGPSLCALTQFAALAFVSPDRPTRASGRARPPGTWRGAPRRRLCPGCRQPRGGRHPPRHGTARHRSGDLIMGRQWEDLGQERCAVGAPELGARGFP